MPPPYQDSYDDPSAPVQFVSPGQGYYNPPPDSQAYRNTMAHVPVQDAGAIMSPSTARTPLLHEPRIRPLSVDEALQFSPLSSIIPYDSGMMPLVNANIKLSRTSFSSTEGKKTGNQKLHTLNQEMVQSAGNSLSFSQNLEGMQNLLQLRDIPEYHFKIPAGGQSSTRRKATDETLAAPRLSPFAKLLLDNSSLSYLVGPHSPKPKSPDASSLQRAGSSSHTRIVGSKQSNPTTRKPSKSSTPTSQIARHKPVATASPQTQQRDLKVSQTPSPNISTRTPADLNEKQLKQSPSTLVPPVPPNLQNLSPPDPIHQVQTQANPLSQPRISTKIKLESQEPNSQVSQSQPPGSIKVLVDSTPKQEWQTPPSQLLPVPKSSVQVFVPAAPMQPQSDLVKSESRPDSTFSYLDQRAQSDATVKELNEVLTDVLETEADAQSNELNSTTEGVIVQASGLDGVIYVLTSAVLIRLDSLLRKVIEKRRLGDVSVDNILQLQKICERAFSRSETMQINLASDWANLEEASRVAEATACQQNLQSARIVLRSMTGGQADKQILSEELLLNSINLLNKVVDGLILPAVEARSNVPDTSVYDTAAACKKQIGLLLYECNKLMQLLLQILSREEVAESAVNQVEYFAIRMLFVENSPTEKESILGIAKFESFRRFAMLVLVEIFSRYPQQRQFIVREVLTSLQKLPTARQHGRQFKLGNGKRLQLVTVLLVRLVQASGVNTVVKSTRSLLKAEKADVDAEEDSDAEGSDDEDLIKLEVKDSQEEMEDDSDIIPSHLVRNVKALHDASISTAWLMVSFLVQKASTASKSGEQPHRHLLDIFVEDLIAVLGLPEWPGAELLLQVIVNKMKELAGGAKINAPMKTMALETLGTLGTAVLDVTFEAQGVVKSLESDESSISTRLIEQFESNMHGNLEDSDVCNWKGPFRIVMDHSGASETHGRTNSAQGFLLTKWAKTLMWGSKGTNHELDENRVNGGVRSLAMSLSKMTIVGKWDNPEPMEISNSQARLAYLVTILHLGFCQSFSFILSLLMSSITSEHITVRARSLKSVTQMLEKDPSLLDRHRSVLGLILKCTNDPSASVKDSSLSLLGKCITLRPSIEREVIQAIIHASYDQTVGIRKRALKLLRDAYLREDATAYSWRMTVKLLAANSIFRRTTDEEESVVELTRQIFEEIWIEPFIPLVSHERISSTDNIMIKEQMSLIIQVLRDYEDLSKHIEQLIHHTLSGKSKAAESSRKICKALVSCAFEGIIDSGDLPGAPAQHEILQALTVFARTEPKLFTADHVEVLKPYVSCLSTGDDLNLFRGVVAIFRSVLPILPTVQHDTLAKIQTDLQKVVPKLPKAELDEVASCLWTICTVLKNPERLLKLTISCLQNLQRSQSLIEMNDTEIQRVLRLIRIAGHFGKYCDFQPHLVSFNKIFPTIKGDLVAGKIVAVIQPFTGKQRPLNLRAVAWEGVGMICQSWPRAFSMASISSDIKKVLQDDELDLQRIILTSVRDFFSLQDQAHDTEANALIRDPLAQGKLGGSMTATDNDGASSLIAQAYLKYILRIALNNTDQIALVATEVVAGISKQGLVHPKEVGPAMVALATSPDQKVVNVSLQQLQSLHSQHETLFEREYMRAVHEAFIYQRDIVRSSAGFVGQPIRAKLHHVYEVIKSSKAKFVTKFLTNVCARLDFELPKLDCNGQIPNHLSYSQFLIENLVFFDFSRLDDVHHVIGCLEKSVSATGSIVAHAINTELLHVTVENVLSQPDQEPEPEPDIDIDDGTLGGFLPEPILGSIEDPITAVTEISPGEPELDPARMRQLTTAAIILTMMWETRTFLRRLYNVSANAEKKGKAKKDRDPSKAPIKSNFVSGEKFLETISELSKVLESTESSKERCKKFAELMAIDDELKVANEDDENLNVDMNGLGFEDYGVDNIRGTKRKGSVSSAGTPRKRQRSRGARSIGGDSRKGSPEMDTWE